MRFILSLSTFVTAVLAAPRTSAPSGAVTVGAGGNYPTIQAAINSLSTSATTAQSIFILAGTYKEQVTIPPRKASLKIYGYTKDTSSYRSNVVTITHSASLLSAGSDKASGTVINEAANTAFYNINIKNTYGAGAQAIALSAYGNQQGYYGVGLYGYQDTLLAQVGKHVYGRCYIEGSVDFIFGQHGIAYVTGSDIRVLAGGGHVTANGKATGSDPSYFVINKSTIDKTRASPARPGSVYLGRPWSQYARVVIQNTTLGAIINTAGWEGWNAGDPRTGATYLGEFGNTGPGAAGDRAQWSKKLSSPVTISALLESDYASWVDAAYI